VNRNLGLGCADGFSFLCHTLFSFLEKIPSPRIGDGR